MIQRCRFTVPKTTWVYIIILSVVVVGAIMREINLLIILAGLMAGPLLISWQLIRLTLRQLSIQRRLPRGVFPDTKFTVEMQVRNGRKHLDSWALRLEDRLRRTTTMGVKAEPELAVCLIPYLAAGNLCHVQYQARLSDRGRYRLGPIRVSTRVPVGLLQGHVTTKEMNDLFVYPKLGHLRQGWNPWADVDQQGQRNNRRQQGLVEGDYYGLREWRSGDSRRWIHWRSTAKRRELVVRQFEQHRHQDYVIVLDLWDAPTEASPPTAEQRIERVEDAVSFAATMFAQRCQQAGGRLTLAVSGQRPGLIRGSANAALLDDAMELLAEALPSQDDTLAEILPNLLQSTSSSDRLLWISHRPFAKNWTDRFASLGADDPRRTRLARAITIATSDPGFPSLFCRDEPSPSKPATKHISEGALS